MLYFKDMTEKIESDFVEALGMILQGEGMPRIAGRLLGVFILSGSTHSFAELSDMLEVSRGSISTNTRLLEDLGIIERVARRGERQDYFRLASEPYAQLVERKMMRAIKAQETIARTANQINNMDGATKQRIGELGSFFSVLAHANEQALPAIKTTDKSKMNVV